MKTVNCHYVPRLTLRKFGEKICTYNVNSGELREDVKLEKAFCESDFYSDETENLLNRKIESQFGSLFANKLNQDTDCLELSRDELKLIKKFLLISVLRSIDGKQYNQQERYYYDRRREYVYQFALSHGRSKEQAKQDMQSKDFDPPFQEVVVPEEDDFQYWMRTLNVVLETDGSPEEILKHPLQTYPAHRWAQVINNGYLAFWDSEYQKNEFAITDIGMTSENEVGWNGTTVHNHKKTDFLASLLQKEKDPNYQQVIFNCLHMHSQFTENFMMFPISARRMIVEIDPFFKFRIMNANRYPMPSLTSLTKLDNENLFYPNDVEYVLPQNGLKFNYHPDDKYIYNIKKLSSFETQYCNALFLDRINTCVGFSSLDKVVRSFVLYKRLNDPPYTPRVDYSPLYSIIRQRYECIPGF